MPRDPGTIKNLSILNRDPMADLGAYRDQRFRGGRTEQDKLLIHTTTLYVGNLSFYTTEEQVHELFSRVGDLKRIVMGLDKLRKTPCGFCFVEYYTRGDTENAMRYVNGTRLDDRTIRTDYDAGFIEGRQYGRGKSGGQVRDEYRTDFDAGRGGFGKRVQETGEVNPHNRGMKRQWQPGQNKRGYFETANMAKIEIGEFPGGKRFKKEMDDE